MHSLLLTIAFFTSTTEGFSLEDSLCGPRCTKFILEYNDIEASLDELADEMEHIDQSGVSLRGILSALERRGLEGQAVEFDKIHNLNVFCPCIIHLTGDQRFVGHFVVLLEITSDFVRLWDGLNGVSLVSPTLIESQMSGNAIVLGTQESLTDQSSMGILGFAGYTLLAIFLLFSLIVAFHYKRRCNSFQ